MNKEKDSIKRKIYYNESKQDGSRNLYELNQLRKRVISIETRLKEYQRLHKEQQREIRRLHKENSRLKGSKSGG